MGQNGSYGFVRATIRRHCGHKKNLWLLSIMLNFALGGGLSTASYAEILAFSNLEAFSNECIRTRDELTCKRALAQSEVLQRQAAAKGNYACQSRLLGLGSDLIMIASETGRVRTVLARLEAVKHFCNGLK